MVEDRLIISQDSELWTFSASNKSTTSEQDDYVLRLEIDVDKGKVSRCRKGCGTAWEELSEPDSGTLKSNSETGRKLFPWVHIQGDAEVKVILSPMHLFLMNSQNLTSFYDRDMPILQLRFSFDKDKSEWEQKMVPADSKLVADASPKKVALPMKAIQFVLYSLK